MSRWSLATELIRQLGLAATRDVEALWLGAECDPVRSLLAAAGETSQGNYLVEVAVAIPIVESVEPALAGVVDDGEEATEVPPAPGVKR